MSRIKWQLSSVAQAVMAQGISVEESKTFSRAYFLETITKGVLSRCNVNLHSYDGDLPVPYWYTDNKGTSTLYTYR